MKLNITTIAQLVPLPLLVATAYANWSDDYETYSGFYAVAWGDSIVSGTEASGYAEVQAACGSLADEGKYGYAYGYDRVHQEAQELWEDHGYSSYTVWAGYVVDESEWHYARADAQATHSDWWADVGSAWAYADSTI